MVPVQPLIEFVQVTMPWTIMLLIQMRPVALAHPAIVDIVQTVVYITIVTTYRLNTIFKYLEAPVPIVAHHIQCKYPMATHKTK